MAAPNSSLLTPGGREFWKCRLEGKRPKKLVQELMGVIFTKLHSRTDAVWKFLQLRDDSSREVAELRDLFDDAFKYGSDPKRIRHVLRAEFRALCGPRASHGGRWLPAGAPLGVTYHVEGAKRRRFMSVSSMPAPPREFSSDAERRFVMDAMEDYVRVRPAMTHAHRIIRREPGDSTTSDEDSSRLEM